MIKFHLSHIHLHGILNSFITYSGLSNKQVLKAKTFSILPLILVQYSHLKCLTF